MAQFFPYQECNIVRTIWQYFKTAMIQSSWLTYCACTSHFHCSTQHNTTYVKKLIEDNNTMDETIRFLAVRSTS